MIPSRANPVEPSAPQTASPEWMGYLKAAGLGAFAVGVGGTAQAAIVTNAGTFQGNAPVFDIVINPVTYTYANPFDIDGDGVNDIRLGTGSYNGSFADDGDTDAGTVFSSNATPGTYVEAFAADALIGPSATEASIIFGSNQINSASFASGGFLGLQTSQGFFGYLDVLVEAGIAAGNTRVTVRGWAYDDSGAAIAAGAVPEPSSLALLAAGAVGLAARRRKAA